MSLALALVALPAIAWGEAAPRAAAQRWSAFELGGVHGFAGLTIAPGMSGYWVYGGAPDVDHAAVMLGLRGGVLFDRIELAAELAPVTSWPDPDVDPMLTFNVSIGGLMRLARSVYWPLRFGLGLTAVNTPTDEVYMLGRADLLGLAYHYGHLLFELSFPSVRFQTDFYEFGLWSWLFNVSVTYVI